MTKVDIAERIQTRTGLSKKESSEIDGSSFHFKPFQHRFITCVNIDCKLKTINRKKGIQL